MFYISNRTLPFLLWIARYHLPSYRAPVDRRETDPDNARALIRNIEKRLKESKTEVHIRETTSKQLEAAEREAISGSSLSTATSASSTSVSNRRLHVELPFHSKFLLIAAYLASYNPVKSDKRFFMKHHGKQRKTLASTRKERTSSQLTGPKAFPLDRMMAIFYSVVDESVRPSANIASQISSLVSLQFLTAVGGADDGLDVPKYKCVVGLDFVTQISKQVQFEIHRYLYDFVNA